MTEEQLNDEQAIDGMLWMAFCMGLRTPDILRDIERGHRRGITARSLRSHCKTVYVTFNCSSVIVSPLQGTSHAIGVKTFRREPNVEDAHATLEVSAPTSDGNPLAAYLVRVMATPEILELDVQPMLSTSIR